MLEHVGTILLFKIYLAATCCKFILDVLGVKLRSKAFQGTSHQQNHLSCVFAPVKSELLSVFWATHQNCLRLLRPRLKISSSTGKNVALWILDMAQCSKRRPWVKQFSGATPDSKMLLLGPQGVSNIFSQRLTENWMRCWDDEYHWISAKIRWPNFHIYFVHVVHLHLPAVPGDYHCADSAADLPGFEHSKGPPRSMQKGSRSPQRSGTHQAQNGLSFHQFSPVQLFEYFEWERLLSRWNAMFSNEPSSGAFQKPWLHGNLKSCERVTGQHLLQVGTLALALEHFWLPRGHTVPRNGTHQAVDPSMR